MANRPSNTWTVAAKGSLLRDPMRCPPDGRALQDAYMRPQSRLGLMGEVRGPEVLKGAPLSLADLKTPAIGEKGFA